MRQLLITLFCALAVTADAQNKPLIKAFSETGFIFGKMSDNGLFVTRYQESEPSKSPQLIDLTTYQATDLQTTAEIARHGCAMTIDVTDDGNIIVGSYEGRPAYYNRTTAAWTTLAERAGCLLAVTPDGHYAVGSTNNSGTGENGEEIIWYTDETPHLWDLTTNSEVAVDALPAVDPKGNRGGLTRFTDISPDGRYLVGSVFVDYPDYAFVVDREADSFRYIGYRQVDEAGMKFDSAIDNLFFISPRAMSTNGQWVVCNGYFLMGGDEFYAPVRHNIVTGETTAYNTGGDDHDMFANVIDNDGNIYGGTPSGSPIREFYIRSGNYWYSLRSLMQQRYGMAFNHESGLDNTGTPYSISADGLTVTAMVDPQYGQNMVMKLKERLVDVCNGLNLLGIYTLDPAPGAQFSTLGKIRLTFDRDVEVIGAQTAARFGTWNSLSGNGIYVDPTDSRTIVVAFRSRTLEGGKQYEFCLPAGTVCVKGDRERTNSDITATFMGRANEPVKVLAVYPADGSTIAKIDNTANPVVLTMDCDVVVDDNAEAWLEAVDEGEVVKRICQLAVAYKGNSVALFPATAQYLYKGTRYRVVLRAGAVTDVTGGGAMADDVVVHYDGSFERETGNTNGVLFADDFNNISNSLAQWLLYDGDHLTPTDEMEAMEFDAQNTPWNFSIREGVESSDYCAASHSCYTPAGQSADWMLTPQIFVPDNLACLTFQAQSYRKGKADRLLVYVWENDEALAYVSRADFNAIKAKGTKVVDEALTPGADEERLEGDWQDFSVDLSAWAGKNIYVCFGNENADQSMVFVDNVRVYRNLPFVMTLSTPEAVENATEVAIAGRLTVANETHTYSDLRLELKDGSGATVDETAATGLSLKHGDTFTFAFAKPMPLTVGQVNAYSIDVCLDGVLTSVEYKVKDFVFTPTKHVVLEEMTGQPCGNCPLGILAISHMESIYGKQFIPIAIHTYDGDPWGGSLTAYSSFLGLNAAPTAVVQRGPGIAMPMVTDAEGHYTMTQNGSLWLDRVAEEMERPTEIEVTASVEYDEATGRYEVPVKVRSALDLTNQTLNLFAVLMEDGLVARQKNYFAAIDDPALGEWGLGGRYGQSVATNVTFNDVVRACIGSSYAGTTGLLPQTLEAGREYEPSKMIAGTVPATVENARNAKVCVMVIDANTGRVVNACVAPFATSDAIRTPHATAHGTAYNLQGQPIGPTFRGVAIKDGKKLIIRF